MKGSKMVEGRRSSVESKDRMTIIQTCRFLILKILPENRAFHFEFIFDAGCQKH